MLDRFIVGRVTRISPEAPVPVVRFESEHSRLGGAANVAHNLAALGGTRRRSWAWWERTRRRTAARAARRRPALPPTGSSRIPARPTVEKVRIVTGRNQQVARIDYEADADATGELEAQLVERIDASSARRPTSSSCRTT